MTIGPRLFVWPMAFGLWLNDLAQSIVRDDAGMAALAVCVLVVCVWRFRVALKELRQ